MSDNDVNTPGLPVQIDPQLRSVWVDNMNLGFRGDNVILMRGFSSLPEGLFEQTRMFCPEEVLQGVVDIFCERTGYTPTIGTNSESKSGKKKLAKKK